MPPYAFTIHTMTTKHFSMVTACLKPQRFRTCYRVWISSSIMRASGTR